MLKISLILVMRLMLLKEFFKLIERLDHNKSSRLIFTFSSTKIIDNIISILLTHNKITEFN